MPSLKRQRGGSLSDFWKKRDVKADKGLIGKAQSFFKDQINKLKDASLRKFGWKKVSKPEIGKMYFYSYLAKHRETLPLWDALPLVIPIEHYKDGFLGINLHYLPPSIRFKFLKQLIKIGGAKNLNDNTKLKLSYNMLKSVATSKMFEPTIHRYLYTQIRSPVVSVKPPDWQIVVFLPSAKWQKSRPY